MTVAVDRSAGDAAHFKDLAAIRQMLCRAIAPNRRPRPFWSTSTLIASSVSRILSNATSTTPASFARLMTGLNAAGFCALTTIASKPESMKLLIAAICAATSSPVETTLNSLSLAAMSGCAAKALAVWIIWIRQVLAMKPLASAMRKGPFLAGNLKNFVLSVHGTKQPGSRTDRRRLQGRRHRRAPRRRTRRSAWRRRRRRW